MTFKEALESGRKFKRPHHAGWLDRGMFTDSIQVESALADDWYLEPEPKKKMKLYAYVSACAVDRGNCLGQIYFSQNDSYHQPEYRVPGLDQEIEI